MHQVTVFTVNNVAKEKPLLIGANAIGSTPVACCHVNRMRKKISPILEFPLRTECLTQFSRVNFFLVIDGSLFIHFVSLYATSKRFYCVKNFKRL